MKLLLLVTLSILPLTAKTIFQEKGGIVAMEAESTDSSLRKWKKKTDVADFSGECHLEFTGNSIMNGPPHSPLKYHFKINKAGTYRLTLRARKRLEGKRHDLSNDCYVSLKGDFEAGGDASLEILKKETKMFGGEPDRWGWANKLDAHKKYSAEYRLKKGETYTLTISGRSKNFNLDRILLIHESKDYRKTQQSNPVESKTGTPSPPERITRSLTNLEGKTISAQLNSLDGNQLSITFKGRLMTIDILTLTEEDQAFLREWANP